MPSGKTHDLITIALAVPVFMGTYAAASDGTIAGVVTAAFLFGGLMFGPDLDTVSKQYSRWLILRFLWFPYRSFFKHRSRWSHGMIFGTLLRVVYFMGAVTLSAFIAAYFVRAYLGGELPNPIDFVQNWKTLGNYSNAHLGARILPAVFFGMWVGAASHTVTDLIGSYVKTGRITEFL